MLEILDIETRYYTIQAANNKGADQTARMCRLICTFVVRNGINRFSHDVAQMVTSCFSCSDSIDC